MDYNEKNYTPPASYQEAYALPLADGEGFRYLHASSAVIKLGGVPVVGVENLTISMNINRSPVNVVGSIEAIAFDTQGVSVNISGSIIQSAQMSLNDSSFYSSSGTDIIKSINKVFDIEIAMMDYLNLSSDGKAEQTNPFITIRNCQNSGTSLAINSNVLIRDSFTAVGTIMERDWAALENFNKIKAT